MVKGLTEIELRVLGCLLEKSRTTPDGYPLTLNSLCNACNQKTNREPVTNYTESIVQTAADNLKGRGLVSTRGGAGNSRVTKYSHRLGRDDRLFNEGAFDEDELALLTMMFLRGPQTVNELKTRTARLHDFATLDDVVSTIEKLKKRDDGPYAMMVGRAPGQKESRFMHLCGTQSAETVQNASVDETATGENPQQSADSVAASVPTTHANTGAGSNTEARLAALESQVAELSQTVRELREALGEG